MSAASRQHGFPPGDILCGGPRRQNLLFFPLGRDEGGGAQRPRFAPGSPSPVWVQPAGVSNLPLDPRASRALHKTGGKWAVGKGRKKFRENNVT